VRAFCTKIDCKANDLTRISHGYQAEPIRIGTEKFSGSCFAAVCSGYCNYVSSPSGLTHAITIVPPEVPDEWEAFHYCYQCVNGPDILMIGASNGIAADAGITSLIIITLGSTSPELSVHSLCSTPCLSYRYYCDR
jgi:hypothetical protein